MERIEELTRFYSAIRHDNRIGLSHISLYMALFQYYNLSGFKNPVQITRAGVMETAKINGLATYHRCIKDLVAFGYILYEPSFNPLTGSRVYLLQAEERCKD